MPLLSGDGDAGEAVAGGRRSSSDPRTAVRRLSKIFGPLRAAGFAIDAVEEPQPVEDAPLSDDLMQVLKTTPVFLFVRAKRPD